MDSNIPEESILDGKKLVNLRMAMGVTQETMAGLLGMATSTLRLLEQGKTNLSPRLRAKVFERLQQIPLEFDTLKRKKFWLAFRGPEYVEFFFDKEDQSEVVAARIGPNVAKRLAQLERKPEIKENADPNLKAILSEELLEKFNEEKVNRNMTSSQLLEMILIYYFQSKNLFMKNLNEIRHERVSDQESE